VVEYSDNTYCVGYLDNINKPHLKQAIWSFVSFYFEWLMPSLLFHFAQLSSFVPSLPFS